MNVLKYPSLFQSLKLGPLTLPNRILMAPLTRMRSLEPGDIPTDLMAEYYSQRASAGLIITEATQVSFEAKGYAGPPGIHTKEQVTAWRKVVDGVHRAGGRCVVQLWHTGRISHPSLQPQGRLPGAPSAIQTNFRTTLKDEKGNIFRADTHRPRALEISEINQIVSDFRHSVINALEAGFDMIEIHGAHGYLIHQFLSPSSNHRDDKYGGDINNRSRFALEIVDAALQVCSADRIGFRMYPCGAVQGVESHPAEEEDALYLIKELAMRKLAYLHLSEPDYFGGVALSDDFRTKIRQSFINPIITAGSYNPEKAESVISKGFADAVAFGRLYISNPDLVERIRIDGPYNSFDKSTFYGGGAAGYTDYPTLASLPPAI